MIAFGIVYIFYLNEDCENTDCADKDTFTWLIIVFVAGFIFSFEFGSGPIPWLYMAEIMTNKAMSAGVVTNQVFTLLISVATPTLNTALGGWLYIIFGIISIVVSLFIIM